MTVETARDSTNFFRYGDRVEIEMRDFKGHSVFGRIEHQVAKVI